MSPYANSYPCAIEGCHKPRAKHGLCSMHYSRLKRNGDPLNPGSRIIGDVDARFWSKVTKTPTCWVYTGYIGDEGYGVFSDGPELMKAHHFLVGKPPKGKEWHHRCENPPCVRPDHLKLVTRKEHRAEDGAPGANHIRQRTHCPQGHPYDEINTYLYRGERRCKTCLAERQRHRRSQLH